MATNFDPAQPNQSGLVIPQGTSRMDVPRLVADEIIAQSEGRIAEVTADDPAPFDAYASTITELTGGTSYTTEGSPHHVTMRFTDDPLYGEGGSSRLFRLYSGQLGTVGAIVDTHCASAPTSDGSEWGVVFTAERNSGARSSASGRVEYDSGADNTYDSPGTAVVLNPGDSSNSYGSSQSTMTRETRVLVWVGDRHLTIKTETTDNGLACGAAHVFVAEPEEGGHYTRGQRPTIFAFPIIKNGHIDDVLVPGVGGGGPTVAFDDPELGRLSNRLLPNGRAAVQRLHVTHTLTDVAHIGYMAGLRVMSDRDEIAKWGMIDVEGTPHVCFHKDDGRAYFVEQTTATSS